MSKVIFIGAGPGDPELITLKGKKLLEKADVVIYAGSLLNPEILKYAKPRAELHDSAEMNREEVFEVMVKAVREGRLGARVHDGDPSFYGAIQEQMVFLKKQNIEYMNIPGVSCLQGSAASLQRELTLPNISQTVIVTRPKGRTPGPESESIRELARHPATMVVFRGTPQLATVVAELAKGGYPKDTPAAVVYKATWPEQKIVRGTLNNIVGKATDAGIKETALIFVGKVLNPGGYDYSKLYDPEFTTCFRKGVKDV